MLVYAQGPQLTVLVDPDYPEQWKTGHYRADLQQWADEAEKEGGYLILFCGDEVQKIEASIVPA